MLKPFNINIWLSLIMDVARRLFKRYCDWADRVTDYIVNLPVVDQIDKLTLKLLCPTRQPPASGEMNTQVHKPFTIDYRPDMDRNTIKGIHKRLKLSEPVVLVYRSNDNKLSKRGQHAPLEPPAFSKMGRKLIRTALLGGVWAAGNVSFSKALTMDTSLHIQMLHVHQGRIAGILVPATGSAILTYRRQGKWLQAIGAESLSFEATAQYLKQEGLMYYRFVLEAGQTLIFNPNGCAYRFENQSLNGQVTTTSLRFLNRYYCHPALKGRCKAEILGSPPLDVTSRSGVIFTVASGPE